MTRGKGVRLQRYKDGGVSDAKVFTGRQRPMTEVALLPGARELIVALKERGHRVVLASSGKPHHVEHGLDLLEVRAIVERLVPSKQRRVNTDPIAPYIDGLSLIRLGLL